MQNILADVAVSMSEFKKSPASVLRAAKSRPVAVLSHNKAAFYMVEPHVFELMMEELADRDLHGKVLARLAERAQAVELDIDTV